MTKTARAASRFLYGSYSWLVLAVIALPSCGVLAVTPGVHRRRAFARSASRLFFLLIGSAVRIEGPGLEAYCPCVVVANHASYLDGIILTAALPAGFTYLIKHEMARVPIVGFILRRLGSAFVNRADQLDRQRTARRLVQLARSGGALGFFPEGQFDATPGLKPFHSGAFSAAARAGLPVVPVVISGARHKLPSGVMLPAPGPLRVCVCEPVRAVHPRSAKELMALARRAMLAELDEPDLASEETAGTAELDDESPLATGPEAIASGEGSMAKGGASAGDGGEAGGRAAAGD